MGVSELPSNVPESVLSMPLPRRTVIKSTGLASILVGKLYPTKGEGILGPPHTIQTQETSPLEIPPNLEHGMTPREFNQNLERMLSEIVPNDPGDERTEKIKHGTKRYWREKDEMGFGIYASDEHVTARVHLAGKSSYSVVTAGKRRSIKGIYIFNDSTGEVGMPSMDDIHSLLHTLNIYNLNEMFRSMHAPLLSLSFQEVQQLFFHVAHIVKGQDVKEHKESIEALSKQDRFGELIQIWNKLTIQRNMGIQLDRDSELNILQQYKDAVEKLGGVVTEEMVEAQRQIDAQIETEFQALGHRPLTPDTKNVSSRFLPGSRVFLGGMSIPLTSDVLHTEIPILTEDEAKAFLLTPTLQQEPSEELQLSENLGPEEYLRLRSG